VGHADRRRGRDGHAARRAAAANTRGGVGEVDLELVALIERVGEATCNRQGRGLRLRTDVVGGRAGSDGLQGVVRVAVDAEVRVGDLDAEAPGARRNVEVREGRLLAHT